MTLQSTIVALAVASAAILLFNWAVELETTRQYETRAWRWVKFIRASRSSWLVASACLTFMTGLMLMRSPLAATLFLMAVCVTCMAQLKTLLEGQVRQAWLRSFAPLFFATAGVACWTFDLLVGGKLYALLAVLLCGAVASYAIAALRDTQGRLACMD